MTPVEDIREAIRCLREGVSIRDTSETLGLARNTVRRYERRARELGWLDPACALPDTATVAEGLKDIANTFNIPVLACASRAVSVRCGDS